MPRRLLSRGRLFAPAVGLMLGVLSAGGVASAQDSEIAQAEAAYLEVDFEGTREHAIEALEGGGLDPTQLVRVYQLLGIASSALGDEDAARDYFVRMLGIDIDAQLDESVPPRLRNPYLEARGIWAARQGRLGIEVGLDRGSSAVRVGLTDPTDLARQVRIAARLEGSPEYAVEEHPAAAAINAPIQGAAEADRVEYYVEILDTHGNVILTEGSAFSPRVVGRVRSEGGGGDVTFFQEPLFWIIVGAALVVGAAIAIGVGVDQRSRLGLQTGVSIGID